MSCGCPTLFNGKLSAVFASIAFRRPSSIWSKRSVSQNPGLKQFTRSRGPSSRANDLVSPSRAPFVDARGEQLIPGRRPNTPETKVIDPPSFSFGLSHLVQCTAPQNLLSNKDRVSDIGSSTIGPWGALPADDTIRESH
eukprot:CAMPEP_0201937502 /NCGR_PEP_ID=MMETSP0903-20130614/39637_2 /ASSEMBLY_ACC=CAM_ASM_000552 /TAXON_ID=420261 /ORGANISM="Thalassiosira antarctica, Strain CCMP982" /LENGTH=138 /DNA_ID=CAMNT_0048478509 /DNA_START=560 /DNA_END=976 /DNA_ORIENTATION=-